MAQAKEYTVGGNSFLANLGKIYALYTGGFFGFVALLAVLEQMGVPNKFIGYGFVFLTIAVYALIGVLSRTSEVGEYYVAGRSVPAFYNGMATGADWMSGASFVGMAGTLFLLGYDGLAFVLGWTGGYVLVAVLIAPFLRKFGAYTVPDFFAARYGGNFARLLAVIVLISCSFTYVTAQIYATGIIASRFLDIDFTVAVYVGLLGILLCSMLGGMKAVTWTQVAQYIVLIVAYLLPVVILSAKKYGIPIPQLTYGQALQEIADLENQMAAKGLAATVTDAAGKVSFAKPHIKPFTDYDPLNFFALIFCLMVGTASLPHILMRYFTTPSVREARSSVAWSLLFIFLLYFTAPAYAAFSKLEVFTLINKGTQLSDLPQWLYTYGKLGLVKVCGANVDTVQNVLAACQKIANHPGILRYQDLNINTDVIVLSTPEIAGMPYVIAGLVAAGGLAAALSTADGLLLAIANALSHDVYYKMISPNASTKTRLVVARILLLIVAIVAAYTASTKPADILSMVAWAFSLAAAGIFPALALGVWWKRANSAGAVLGMILGFGACLYYLVGTRYYAPSFYETWSWLSTAKPEAVAKYAELKAACAADATKCVAFDKHAQGMANWWGVKNISAALFGLPLGFITIFLVSLLTPAPSKEVQDLVDATRRPSGGTLMQEKGALAGGH
ncbi:MAG: cation acetate symporter [Hyphomicrobiaceae bacterium]|nr:cation acetate symporter [Hyphomicrobiaceae bacterium]